MVASPRRAVTIVQRRETYVVTGSKAEHLTEAMALAGPRRDGRVHTAYTDWEVAWEHGDALEDGGHRPASPTVTVTITSTFPRWRPPPSASAELVRAFEDYLAIAEDHERRHAEHAIAAACDVLDRLRALPAQPTARALAEAAREVACEALAIARARDAALDAHPIAASGVLRTAASS
jgi:predicted secreted Zn-dependent protease